MGSQALNKDENQNYKNKGEERKGVLHDVVRQTLREKLLAYFRHYPQFVKR